MASLLFKRSVVRIGAGAFVNSGDGIWHNLGDLRGGDLRDLARRLRYPLLYMWLDKQTLPDATLQQNARILFDESSNRICGRY